MGRAGDKDNQNQKPESRKKKEERRTRFKHLKAESG
jgi:hypothetical protein